MSSMQAEMFITLTNMQNYNNGQLSGWYDKIRIMLNNKIIFVCCDSAGDAIK